MSYHLSPLFGAAVQLQNNNGALLAGGKIFTYAAGTTTPAATWTTSAGNIQNANPIILDSFGRIPNEIWLLAGNSYKFVVEDSVNNPIGIAWDNITGVNDVSTIQNEWLASGVTPNFVSSNQFSIVGNYVSLFEPNRRVLITDSGISLYGYIRASSYATGNTTVTAMLDSGSIDNAISAVSVGTLDATHESVPNIYSFSGTNGNNLVTDTVAAVTLIAGMSGITRKSTYAGIVAYTLPAVAAGLNYTFNYNAYANSITGAANSLLFPDGTTGTTFTMPTITGQVSVVCDGNNWRINNTVNMSSSRVHTTIAQVINVDTYTVVQFNTVDFDDQTEFNTGTYMWTVKSAGTYMVGAGITGSQVTVTARIITVFINAIESSNMQGTYESGYYTIGGSVIIRLNAGDTVDIQYYTGLADTLNTNTIFTYATLERLK